MGWMGLRAVGGWGVATRQGRHSVQVDLRRSTSVEVLDVVPKRERVEVHGKVNVAGRRAKLPEDLDGVTKRSA